MGTAGLGKLIFEFAIPSIISMIVNGSYQIIDSIFLGLSLQEIGQATVAVASPVMTMSMAISILVGAGGNALAAIKLGEGKRDVAEKVLGNTFTLSVVLALLSTLLVFLFMDPILTFSGATQIIHEPAGIFIGIIAAGFIFQYLGMALNNFMRTAGNPKGALYTMMAGMAVSIVLNYLFVMVLGWGVAGSAWATIIGQFVTCLLVLYYFTLSKRAPFKLKLPALKLKPQLIGSIFALGSPSFFLQAAAVVINLILNNQLTHYGALDPVGAEGALAAIGGVAMRIAMFAFFPILGISVGIQPLLGYNYGAKLYGRVKKTFLISLVWMAGFGTVFWAITMLFPVQIVELFGVQGELHDFTIGAIKVMMILLPILGLQVLATGYFQATGQPLKSMFMSLTRQLIYLIPLLYALPLLVEHVALGITPLQSLYYAYPLSDLLSIITALIMMIIEWRRLAQLQGALQQGEEQHSAAVL